MPNLNLVFVGIRGSAVALDRITGKIVWERPLKGSEFVHLVLEGDSLYATARGEIFCLDPGTGVVRWNNALKGYGWGLASIAVSGGTGNIAALLEAEAARRREQQQHAAGTSTV